MASETLARMRANPTLRGAIVAPALIATIFVLFNLTGAVDPQTAVGAMRLGVVNLDQGATGPAGEIRLSEQILQGLGGRAPFAARILISEHLSAAEVQLGASLPATIEANLGTAVTMARLAVAARIQGPPGPPPVTVTTEPLHVAANARMRIAPVILMFAGGLGGLIGTILLHMATRGRIPRGAFAGVALVRTALPVVATGLSSLLGVVMVGLATEVWADFVTLWLYGWLVAGMFMVGLVGLFSLLGFFGVIVGLPLVFYQGLAAGALAAAARSWVSWINDVVPLPEILVGWRAILIGGPEGAMPITEVIFVLVVGVALIWVATGLHAALRPAGAPAET